MQIASSAISLRLVDASYASHDPLLYTTHRRIEYLKRSSYFLRPGGSLDIS
jgi:hypothetical protein